MADVLGATPRKCSLCGKGVIQFQKDAFNNGFVNTTKMANQMIRRCDECGKEDDTVSVHVFEHGIVITAHPECIDDRLDDLYFKDEITHDEWKKARR